MALSFTLPLLLAFLRSFSTCENSIENPTQFLQFLLSSVTPCNLVLFGISYDAVEVSQIHQNPTHPLFSIDKNTKFKAIPTSLSLVTRFAPNCRLHVSAFISQTDVNIYNENLARVWSNQIKFVKKISDYFVFVLPKSYERLELNSVAMSVQHKVFVSQNAKRELILLHFCAFCSEKSMEMYPINLNTSNENKLLALFPNYVRNLNGHKIRASVPSAVHARVGLKIVNGEYRTERGLQLVLLNMLRDELNFTYKVFPSTGGGGTGLQTANGSWTGVVGDIYHDRADLGFGVGISLQRSQLIDFVGYYEYISLTFTHGPQRRIFTWRAIFWPFSTKAWLFLLLCFVVTLAAFAVSVVDARAKTRKYHLYAELEKTDALKITWGELVMFFYASLLSQEGRIPRVNSARTLSAFWFFVALVVSTAYTSKLFGFLAFPVHEQAPETFEELADSEFGVGLRYIGGYGYNMFKTSTSPSLHKIFKRMDLIKDSLECFRRTMSSRYCCISYELQFEYTVNRNLSDRYGRTPLIMAPGRVFPVSVGLGVQKEAIFGAKVNSKITSAFETGLVKQWSDMDMNDIHLSKLKWIKNNNASLPEIVDNTRPMPVSMPQLTGSFTVLVLGIVMSGAACLGEFGFRRLKLLRKIDEQVFTDDRSLGQGLSLTLFISVFMPLRFKNRHIYDSSSENIQLE